MRRFLSIALLVVVVAAVIWTLLNWERAASATTDPWTAMPDRSAIVIEIPDAWVTWDHFTHTSQFWTALEQVGPAMAMGRLMARTTERTENDAALRHALTDVTMLVSVTRTGHDAVDLLFACTPRTSDGVPLNAFAELLKADEASMAALQRGEVVQVRPDTALPVLSLCIQQGLWLLATSPVMMDEALLQLKNGGALARDSLLHAARNTLGSGSDAHVLVHLERAHAMLNTWWTPAAVERLDLPTGWAALDLRARPDAFLLSGLLFPAGQHPALIDIDHQGTGRNDLARWLPAQASAWDVRHVGDAEKHLHDLGVANESDLSALAPSLFNWVHGSVGLASAVDTLATGPQRWAFFQTDDPEGAVNDLNGLCPIGTPCDTITYRGTRLTRLPITNAHERLLGPAYADLVQPWWCALGDVIVLAPEQTTLRTVVDAWNDGRTLAEDERTSAWTERMASTAGRTLRWDIARHADAFTQGMGPGAAEAFRARRNILQRLGGLSIQLSPAQHGRTHLAIGLQHVHAEERATGIHWSTAIPAGAVRKPDILVNHTNGTREVLVQDGEHRIHLLGSSGKLLWSRPLDGPILGAVQQVDRFRNGKLQLLFNTAGHLYLIDRNGKDVGGFPVNFPEGATAPIAVLDYDAQRDYRVIVPVADGRVVNYGMEGTEVKGWETPRLSKAATNAVVHVRISNKDHLLLFDGNGAVRVVDRRGVPREHAALTLGPDPEVRLVSPGLDLRSTRIIWADSSGALIASSLDGKRTTLAPGGGGGRNQVGGLGDDGRYDILRTAADSLVVSHAGTTVFTRTFGTPVGPDVHLYTLSGGASVIGLRIPEREQVTLIDGAGNTLDGMPLQGISPLSIADLDLDGTLELVTVTREGRVVAYHALPSSRAVP